MAETIVIKKSYFNNIETAVNAINEFVQSGYKSKNFPKLNWQADDISVSQIVNLFETVDPEWISNPSAIDSVITDITEAAKGVDLAGSIESIKQNPNLENKISQLITFFEFKQITDHFDELGALLNGIYSFELFTNPSKFRSEIELFSTPELPEIVYKLLPDIGTSVFAVDAYVNGLFRSPYITFPATMNAETEVERIKSYQPLPETINVVTDQTIQEAAEINYFIDAKPQHIKYDSKNNKFVLSDQLKKIVNGIISAIEGCDDTDSLRNYFSSKEAYSAPDMLTANTVPFILAKVYNNKSKFPDDKINVDNLSKYIKSYGSITDKNPGTRRFINYDLFSTFKIDKEGTVNFLKDFLNLNLVNSPNARITNNGLLSCFNIFDSRIYLDTLYNLIPKEHRKDKYATEDGFVKFIRARVNKNSRNSNVYAEDEAVTSPDNDAKTEKAVAEAAYILKKQFGDMTPSDMHLCEQYHAMLYNELDMLDSKMFSEGVSQSELANELNEIITETDAGKIPEYMQTRVKLSDEQPNVSLTSIPASDIPIPTNPIPDLASSIDSKVDNATDYENMLGAGATASSGGGNTIYHITNNYYNSNNKKIIKKKSVHKTDDHSTGKTVEDNSTGKTINNRKSSTKVTKGSHNSRIDIPFNNNNNSEDQNDTSKEANNLSNEMQNTPEGLDDENLQEFSTGFSIGDVFAFLEDGELTSAMSSSEEPLSSSINTMEKPRSDLLTTAMDVDRNTLSFQQKAKHGVQKGIQTVDAFVKPVTRAKQWLAGIVDSLVERKEDKVKADIIENPSYRTKLFKAGRLALKLGLFGILFTINGYIGAAYAVAEVASLADRERLKKEVQGEFAAEMKILDDKIRLADQDNTPESRKAKWEMMRIRSKMERIVTQTPKSVFKTTNTIV